jgi:hypothetical protein
MSQIYRDLCKPKVGSYYDNPRSTPKPFERSENDFRRKAVQRNLLDSSESWLELTHGLIQYKNRTIKLMGLRRRPKRKPSGNKDDIYRILHAHWTRCRRAYADEKQRFYVAAGILLSYISGSRLVSLFDTRVKKSDAKVRLRFPILLPKLESTQHHQ